MTNHPHDCPTCDEGGECHLQDMTVMTGHTYRRYRFNKRTFTNQYLGPLVNHEMNRCIACYRCVRFYKDYAGGKDLEVMAAHNHVYFGRHKDGVLESEFSGNLVEICPTGVFTDKTLKNHYTRKWDFTSAPSVCNLCSLGCNTIAGERYGEIRRIKSRFNYDVNGYFICDRGRYGYEYMNAQERIRAPLVRNAGSGKYEEKTLDNVLDDLEEILQNSGKIFGIGSPSASLESNYALRKLTGGENFSTGMSDTDHDLSVLASEILAKSGAKKYSMKDVEKAECVLILGEDLTNTAPMLALAVRQSVRQIPMKKLGKLKIHTWDDKAVREAIQTDKGPLYSITPAPTKLDELGKKTIHLIPKDIARLGFAIAHFIDKKSALPSGLPKNLGALAEEIASDLTGSENAVVISGTSCMDAGILKAASDIASAMVKAKKHTGICLTFPEANSSGLSLLGGKKLSEIERGNTRQMDCLIILENDIYRRMPEKDADALLDSFQNVISLNYLENRTTFHSSCVLPAAVIAESDGHLVNNEGRVQPFYRVHKPGGNVQPAWRWIQALAGISGKEELAAMENLADYDIAIARDFPVFAGLKDIVPDPGYRIGAQKIARETHRYSGRTAIHANKTINEPRPPDDLESPMTFSMEGFHGYTPAPFNPYFWSPGWNSIQSLNKFQIETGGELRRKFPELCLFDADDANPASIPVFGPEENDSVSNDEWNLIPLYHIFGSEELSIRNGGSRELVPTPYIALNPDTAAKKGWKEGAPVLLETGNQSIRLDIKLVKGIPGNAAGIPRGLEGIPFIAAGDRIKIKDV